MSQNLRVATFIPQENPSDTGQAVLVTGVSGTGKVIPTAFGDAGGGSGSGLPLPTAAGQFLQVVDSGGLEWQAVNNIDMGYA